MCAAVAFYQKALDAGIKPIPGAVLDLSCLPELIASGMHPGTKNLVMFVTLEDRGVYEVVLFPEAYNRYGGLSSRCAPCATGRIEADGRIDGEKLEASRKYRCIS